MVGKKIVRTYALLVGTVIEFNKKLFRTDERGRVVTAAVVKTGEEGKGVRRMVGIAMWQMFTHAQRYTRLPRVCAAVATS